MWRWCVSGAAANFSIKQLLNVWWVRCIGYKSLPWKLKSREMTGCYDGNTWLWVIRNSNNVVKIVHQMDLWAIFVPFGADLLFLKLTAKFKIGGKRCSNKNSLPCLVFTTYGLCLVPEMNRSKWRTNDQDPNLMKLSWLLGKRNNLNAVPEVIRRR